MNKAYGIIVSVVGMLVLEYVLAMAYSFYARPSNPISQMKWGLPVIFMVCLCGYAVVSVLMREALKEYEEEEKRRIKRFRKLADEAADGLIQLINDEIIRPTGDLSKLYILLWKMGGSPKKYVDEVDHDSVKELTYKCAAIRYDRSARRRAEFWRAKIEGRAA